MALSAVTIFLMQVVRATFLCLPALSKQLQRTVIGRRGRGASASFHYARRRAGCGSARPLNCGVRPSVTIVNGLPKRHVGLATAREFWNANTHYHSLVLASLSHDVSRVLDVGCGDGILSAELCAMGVPHVLGLDVDRAVLDRARARHQGKAIEWVHGDIFKVALEPESFDAVVSVAALHHMDAGRSLTRFAELIRPGGTMVIVGLAANSWSDIPLVAVGMLSRLVLRLVHGRWDHSAPQSWPPPLTYREMKTLSADLLPGVRYRRHLLSRYSLVWRKPRADSFASALNHRAVARRVPAPQRNVRRPER